MIQLCTPNNAVQVPAVRRGRSPPQFTSQRIDKGRCKVRMINGYGTLSRPQSRHPISMSFPCSHVGVSGLRKGPQEQYVLPPAKPTEQVRECPAR